MGVNTVMRDPLIDALKGYAIFLVIWGHCIQCLGEGMTVLSQPIGTFIYLFHMPLFFFLSGYVSVNALSRKLGDLLLSRLKSLFLPMCLWALICLVVKIGLGVVTLPDPVSKMALFKMTFFEINGAYWFIWVLLDCIFFAWIVSLASRTYRTWLLLASAVLLLFLPDLPFVHINGFKCMYPFFVGGILFRQYDVFEWIQKRLLPNLILWGGDLSYAF